MKCLILVVVAACIPLLAGGCSDVSSKHIAISYVDAYAAGGESIRLAIATRRASAGSISSVRVDAPSLNIENREVYTRPLGADPLSSSIKTETSLKSMLISDPNHPRVEIEIPIPVGMSEASLATLNVEVDYSIAKYDSPGMFDWHTKTEQFAVPITIVSPGREWMARGKNILLYALILTGLIALASAGRRAILHRWPKYEISAGGIVFLGCIAAVWFAIRPLHAIFGYVTPLARIGIGAALLLSTVLVVEWIFKKLMARAKASRPAT